MVKVEKTEVFKLVEVIGFEKVMGTPCFVFVLPPNTEVGLIKTEEDLIKFLVPALHRKKKGKYPFIVWSFGPTVAHGTVEKTDEEVVSDPNSL